MALETSTINILIICLTVLILAFVKKFQDHPIVDNRKFEM